MDKVEELLELHDLEEVFEVLDITPYEVVKHLLRAGLVVLPPYLEDDLYVGEEYEEAGQA